jgi:hypothetical protein
MTLVQWMSENGAVIDPQPTRAEPGRAIAIPDRAYSGRAALWALEDFSVSSVVAGTIWLVPKGAPRA